MQELRKEIERLEEEHETERERLYLLQNGKTYSQKPRDISTAKLRQIAEVYNNQKKQPPITLPQIFTLYALNQQENCDCSIASSMTNVSI